MRCRDVELATESQTDSQFTKMKPLEQHCRSGGVLNNRATHRRLVADDPEDRRSCGIRIIPAGPFVGPSIDRRRWNVPRYRQPFTARRRAGATVACDRIDVCPPEPMGTGGVEPDQ